jgi:hypothetical protein
MFGGALPWRPTYAFRGEALWKEREDAIGATEDARREAEKEQVAAAVVKSVHDVAQIDAARPREELKGMGRSLSPSLLPVGSGL